MADTWTPRYLVQKAPGVGGKPIPEDEPCLVIRGQDLQAVAMLKTYIAFYQTLGYAADPKVIADLEEHLDALIEWQGDHAVDCKWADR